jgi:MFS family permease
MTAGRWTGPNLITRFGRVVAVRILAAVGIAGILLFVLGPTVTSAFAGALLWGAGASLGFPLGMSAGADDPALAAPRVSVIASIGYCAFLGGPPFIGFLGNHVSVRYALLAVGVLFTVSMVISGAIRPLRPQDHVQLEVPAEPGARPVQSAQDLTALGSGGSGGREELRLE